MTIAMRIGTSRMGTACPFSMIFRAIRRASCKKEHEESLFAQVHAPIAGKLLRLTFQPSIDILVPVRDGFDLKSFGSTDQCREAHSGCLVLIAALLLPL